MFTIQKVSDFQEARAILSTLFHAVLLTDTEYRECPRKASYKAIDHAEALLEEMGIVDLDR